MKKIKEENNNNIKKINSENDIYRNKIDKEFNIIKQKINNYKKENASKEEESQKKINEINNNISNQSKLFNELQIENKVLQEERKNTK